MSLNFANNFANYLADLINEFGIPVSEYPTIEFMTADSDGVYINCSAPYETLDGDYLGKFTINLFSDCNKNAEVILDEELC